MGRNRRQKKQAAGAGPLHPRHLLRIRILEISVIVLVVFSGLLWQDVFTSGASIPPAEAAAKKAIRATVAKPLSIAKYAGVPLRLRIARIGVDAPVVKVVLKKDGSMDVPRRPVDTGWYSLGPRPGNIGNAVIAGHVDWLNGADAVFADLDTLKAGDIVTVEDANGIMTSFVVTKTRSYDATADAIDVFSSSDGKAHLNLITCSGSWDINTKQYTKRLVVFTDKVVE